MATTDQFLSIVVNDIPGVPEPTALQAITNACVEFCKRSSAWKQWINVGPMVNNQRSYTPALPAQSVIVTLQGEVTLAGAPEIAAVPEQIMQDWVPDYRNATGNLPRFVTRDVVDDTISVWPLPSAVAGLTMQVRMILAPAFSATTVPDFLLNKYQTTIASCAKAELCFMPKQAWSDADRAASERMKFEQLLGVATLEAAKGGARGPSYIKPRKFG